MTNLVTVEWLKTWITTPSANFPPDRPREVQTLRLPPFANVTPTQYAEALTSAVNNIAVLHSTIFARAALLPDGFAGVEGVVWADVRRICAWEELLSWPFDQDGVEEWRESLVEAGVHSEFAGGVLARLDRAAEGSEGVVSGGEGAGSSGQSSESGGQSLCWGEVAREARKRRRGKRGRGLGRRKGRGERDGRGSTV